MAGNVKIALSEKIVLLLHQLVDVPYSLVVTQLIFIFVLHKHETDRHEIGSVKSQHSPQPLECDVTTATNNAPSGGYTGTNKHHLEGK